MQKNKSTYILNFKVEIKENNAKVSSVADLWVCNIPSATIDNVLMNMKTKMENDFNKLLKGELYGK